MEDKLELLKKECLECQKCRLFKTRQNVVFGKGSVEAKVMFIGEGPGEQEDLQGEPFVGRAGKLLDKMLKAVDLDRESGKIYITNIVKCRPPKNRDPQTDEQQACINYLYRQIELINPEIIVFLGRISAKKLMKDDIKITKEHGILYRKNNMLMMAMLHPSALLRTPSLKPEAFEDFIKLRSLISGEKEYEVIQL